MTPTLEKLFYGHLCCAAAQSQTEEYLDSYNAAEQNFQQLREECTPNQYERIRILLDEHDIMNSIDREEMFQRGFSLGVRLVVEALSQ